MSDEVEIDQEVYDRLIAEGKGERVARAKAKAAAIRKARAAAAAEAEAAEPAAAPAADAPTDDAPQAETPAPAAAAPAADAPQAPAEGEIDQEVYDRLIAEGKSERIARAKAKAAAIRKAKIAQGQKVGPKSAEEAQQAQESSRAAAAAGAEAKVPAAAAAAPAAGGRLTPEQRAERVAASLGGNGGQTSMGVPAASDHTHRLLALVPPAGIQQVQSKQMDKVYTWPHLLLVEFVALLTVGSLLLIAAFFLDAPLGSLANPNEVPAINKAPWYFMGLQELLRYFHPMVAGVTLPGVFLVVLGAAPYVDKNPSARPENRKFANMAFTFFMTFWAILVIIGSFLRGAGYEWVWPWVQGLGFSL